MPGRFCGLPVGGLVLEIGRTVGPAAAQMSVLLTQIPARSASQRILSNFERMQSRALQAGFRMSRYPVLNALFPSILSFLSPNQPGNGVDRVIGRF